MMYVRRHANTLFVKDKIDWRNHNNQYCVLNIMFNVFKCHSHYCNIDLRTNKENEGKTTAHIIMDASIFLAL